VIISLFSKRRNSEVLDLWGNISYLLPSWYLCVQVLVVNVLRKLLVLWLVQKNTVLTERWRGREPHRSICAIHLSRNGTSSLLGSCLHSRPR